MGTAAEPPRSGDGPLRRPPLHHQSRPPQHPRHGVSGSSSSSDGGLGGGGAMVSSGDSINSGSVGSCGSGQGSLPPPPTPPMRYGASSLLPPSLGLDLDGMKETILQRLLATPADREEDLLGFARWCLTFVGRTFTAHRTGLAPPPLRAPPTSMPTASSSPTTSTATVSCSSSAFLSSFSSSPPARDGNGERYHHHQGAAGAVEVGYSDSESAAGSCGGSDAGGVGAGKQQRQRRRVRAKTVAGDASARVSLKQEPNDAAVDLPRKAAAPKQQLHVGKGGNNGKEDAVSHQEMDVISILLDFSSQTQARKHSGGSAASPTMRPTPMPTTTNTSNSIKPPPPPSPTPSLGSLGAAPYMHPLPPLNVNVIAPESSPPRRAAEGQVAASAIPPLVAAASSPLARSPPATPATALTAVTADGGSSCNSGTYAHYMQAGSPSHGIRFGCYTYFHGVGERGSHKTMLMGQALSWTNEASGGGNGHSPADPPTLVVAGAVHLTRDPALHAALVFDAHKEAFFLLPTPVLLASPVLTRRFISEPALAELKQRVSGWGVGGPHLELTAAELALSPAAMMAAAEAAGAGSREFGAGGLWACLWGAMMEQGRGGGGGQGQQGQQAPGQRRTSAYPTSSPSRASSPSSFYSPQGPPSPATALALAAGAAVSSASAAARYLPYFGAFPPSQPQQPQQPQHMPAMPPPPPAPVVGGGRAAAAAAFVTTLPPAPSPSPSPPRHGAATSAFYPSPAAVGTGFVFSSAPVAPDARA